jgi:hypothetical protein
MGESLGKVDETMTALMRAKEVAIQGSLQQSTVVILTQMRTKPSKPDAKEKKAKALKAALQAIRKLGFKENELLPKAVHEAAIRAIATGGAS